MSAAPPAPGGALRVLYVSHTGVLGGGERSLLDLLRHLPARVEPVVATPSGPLADALRAAGVPVVAVPAADVSLALGLVRTPRGLAGLAAAAAAVRAAARRTGAGLVHANSIRAGLVAAPRPVRGPRPALVAVRDRLPPGAAARAALAVLDRSGALLVANSAWTAAGLRRPAAARVLHPPVDLERFDPARAPAPAAARAALGLAPDAPVIAMVGQITAWKGHDIALRALAGLPAPATLLVAGDVTFHGPAVGVDNAAYATDLERLAADLGVRERVRFLGATDDVPAVLAAADVLALPSRGEPFGRVVAEAMAMARPVVVTTRGGPAELVRPDVEGLLVDPTDVPGWTAALAALLADPGRRARMGAAGRERVRALAAPAHAGAVVALYDALTARAAARRPGSSAAGS